MSTHTQKMAMGAMAFQASQDVDTERLLGPRAPQFEL